ncbi:Hypothetical_protein [Hexamita inflata]|uniref:Hypothetical_protein n=1 Tax=Hexamita inflata TaxID=28002 RepID=A0AA86NQN0_9EUKA|nr:Hypothetical protein HINF_LOCUS11517 [Hexamita inflata]CAI9923882.1 Hypothetical protein HINF_LOCUS11527 [Hexamita inflata]
MEADSRFQVSVLNPGRESEVRALQTHFARNNPLKQGKTAAQSTPSNQTQGQFAASSTIQPKPARTASLSRHKLASTTHYRPPSSILQQLIFNQLHFPYQNSESRPDSRFRPSNPYRKSHADPLWEHFPPKTAKKNRKTAVPSTQKRRSQHQQQRHLRSTAQNGTGRVLPLTIYVQLLKHYLPTRCRLLSSGVSHFWLKVILLGGVWKLGSCGFAVTNITWRLQCVQPWKFSSSAPQRLRFQGPRLNTLIVAKVGSG